MADNVAITAGSGTTISTEEVTTLNGGAVSAQQVQRVAIASRTADGTAVDLIGSTADGLTVNLGTNNDVTVTGTVTVGSHAVTNAGTFVVQENGAALTALQLIDDTIFADDAGVTLGTSKGSIAAGVAVQTDGTDPSVVSAEADAAALRTDMQRILLVNMTHPRGTTISQDYASAQTNASVIAAPGAGLSIYITDIQLSNGATAGNVTLLNGSAGTVMWEAYPAINGGAVMAGMRQPIRLSANTALCLTSTTVTTHSIFIGYYIAP